MVVGTLGLLSMRGGGSSGADGLVIQAGGPAAAQGGAPQNVTAAVGQGGTPSSLSTTTTQPRKIWVQVVGAVRRPGVYQVEADVRVFQAVLEAGGFTEDADQEAVALAAALSDGCRIYVPREGEGPVPGGGLPPNRRLGSREARLRAASARAGRRVPCHSTRPLRSNWIRSQASARQLRNRSSPTVKPRARSPRWTS